MNFETSLFLTLILSGIIFIIVALVLYAFPPKKINFLYGYRTSSSMKSQERWDYAQKKGAVTLLQSGIGLLIVSFISLFLSFSEKTGNSIAIAVIIAAAVVLFIRTERAIKKKFIVK